MALHLLSLRSLSGPGSVHSLHNTLHAFTYQGAVSLSLLPLLFPSVLSQSKKVNPACSTGGGGEKRCWYIGKVRPSASYHRLLREGRDGSVSVQAAVARIQPEEKEEEECPCECVCRERLQLQACWEKKRRGGKEAPLKRSGRKRIFPKITCEKSETVL